MIDLFDLFGEFVEILGVKIHLWTVIVILVTLLIYFYLLRRLHPIYNLLTTVTFVVFSKSVLELSYFVVLGGFSLLDFLFILGLLPVLYGLNSKFHFLKWSKLFGVVVVIQIVVFVAIFVVGAEYVLFNPHGEFNWLWALSKMCGLSMWLPLIKKREGGD